LTNVVQTQSRTKHFLCQGNVAAFYRDKFTLKPYFTTLWVI